MLVVKGGDGFWVKGLLSTSLTVGVDASSLAFNSRVDFSSKSITSGLSRSLPVLASKSFPLATRLSPTCVSSASKGRAGFEGAASSALISQ